MSKLKSLRIPDSIFRSIEDLAYAERITTTDAILQLVRDGLNKHREETAINISAFDSEFLDRLSEGLAISPTDDEYEDWLRSEVLRLEIARWPVES